MDGAPSARIEQQVENYRQAAADARAVFTEEEMRPFLTCASDVLGDDHFNQSLKRDGGCPWWG
jgi:hypothetical protein